MRTISAVLPLLGIPLNHQFSELILLQYSCYVIQFTLLHPLHGVRDLLNHRRLELLLAEPDGDERVVCAIFTLYLQPLGSLD